MPISLSGFVQTSSNWFADVASTISAIVQKWVPYSQRYLFNAIPDTNHNANPTNPTNPTNPNTIDTVVNKAPTSAH